MHEFNTVDGGTKALNFSMHNVYKALDGVETSSEAGWLADIGIRELGLDSGDVSFKWLGSDHINATESNTTPYGFDSPLPKRWNYLHLNSVNKNADGDYLVSARLTDSIFKISGHDGSVLWHLGGLRSSFKLDDFNFSRQHDAQWVSPNDEVEIITFLDNGADNLDPPYGPYPTSEISSGLLVELDKRTMKARVLKRWIRPDQGLSRLRGNMQNLPGGNVLMSWSDNAYMTEHSVSGDLLAEARFTSERFVTYRAYKFNFTGMPAEAKPVLKAFAHGITQEKSSTVIYTSWNGATDIASWKYYCTGPEQDPRAIGEAARTGFVTTFYTSSYECGEVFAEAIDQDGIVMGTALPSATERPKHWGKEKCDGADLDLSAESIRSEL
ncbi:uncharacterized protein CLAFUR5_03623 [Fulvia fulva]|uniref:ASST-domain-containing protein n=1 Tax=Passalora fulva TaxID=5499 RepID=A0A9Q8P4Q3_PASFU|nr:uncharacterized protein CLAFUR5_03623 [Fulvia fulva]UJO13066.1 hypothetical protein CLAFUR5_03623 [Fulvia fulva]